jgi:hypothetical protein
MRLLYNESMRTLAAFLTAYISGGVWYFTHPEACGAVCLPPGVAFLVWLAAFAIITLFLVMVFPSIEQSENSGMAFRYLWAAMVVVILIQTLSALYFAN